MTKEEAAAKVRKLRNQAKGTDSASEAKTARKLADEIMAKHGLKESDLMRDSKVAAFDELLSELDSYGKSRSLPPAVAETIAELKKTMNPKEKIDALEKVVGAVRIGAFFMKGMAPIKEIVEGTLRKHEVVV